jgi:DNA polymerase-3 subunit delta
VVAVKAGDVDRILRRGDLAPLLLIYGPDAGLVAERARHLAEGAVDEPADPFQLVRIDGDTLAQNPARLADEAGTIGLFGGRRAVWVRPTSRNIAAAVAACLDVPLQDTVVVIEAGDLSRSAPLRALVERAPAAMALPCYADGARDLAAVVDATLQEAGLGIDRQTRAFLIQSLGGDRLATRAELAKLVLYAHGRKVVSTEDVEAVISDVSASGMDAAVDAAFGGDLAALDLAFARAEARSGGGSALLGSALRHGVLLLSGLARLESGEPASAAVGAWRGLHFSRRDAVARQLEIWTRRAAGEAVTRLQNAVLDSRRMPAVANAAAARALLDLARAARVSGRR